NGRKLVQLTSFRAPAGVRSTSETAQSPPFTLLGSPPANMLSAGEPSNHTYLLGVVEASGYESSAPTHHWSKKPPMESARPVNVSRSAAAVNFTREAPMPKSSQYLAAS